LIGRRGLSRIDLLLAFGRDCAGAVSIVSSVPMKLHEDLSETLEPKDVAALRNRASLSGVQPKVAIVKGSAGYRVAEAQEVSTHIAKFSATEHPNLIFNEYLSTRAFQALCPEVPVAALDISRLENIVDEPILIIERFDRIEQQGVVKKIHFEEANSCLQYMSEQKYSGSYEDLSKLILSDSHFQKTDNYKIFCKILVSLLLGNTDLHWKNFAFFHTARGLSLSPSYDNVSAVLDGYHTVALGLCGAENLKLNSLRPKNIIALCRAFDLPLGLLEVIYRNLEIRKPLAIHAIQSAPHGEATLKEKIILNIETQWITTFASIGQVLSSKPKRAERKPD
jgi:serine/threonine-protein kinase HipA